MKNKISRRKFIKRTLLASISIGLIDAFWFERYIIEWNYFDKTNSSNSKIKIVQVSDLHIQTLWSFHKSIARKINKLKPDFVFITGDAVDKNKNISELDNFLSLIDTSIKKSAITGNWEYWGKIDLLQLRNVYQKHNCDFLINENRTYSVRNQQINIIGVMIL